MQRRADSARLDWHRWGFLILRNLLKAGNCRKNPAYRRIRHNLLKQKHLTVCFSHSDKTFKRPCGGLSDRRLLTDAAFPMRALSKHLLARIGGNKTTKLFVL